MLTSLRRYAAGNAGSPGHTCRPSALNARVIASSTTVVRPKQQCCHTQAGLAGAQAQAAIRQVLQNLRSFAMTVEGDDGVALVRSMLRASLALCPPSCAAL